MQISKFTKRAAYCYQIEHIVYNYVGFFLVAQYDAKVHSKVQ